MVADRIERHDILNALLLALVLLLLGMGMITGVRSLASTVDEGLVVSSKDPQLGSEASDSLAPAEPTDTTPSTAAPDGEDTGDAARPPAEVAVRVGNGADRRPGLAGAGTEELQKAGYQTLPPENGPTLEVSVVYFNEGYEADAAKIANVLGIDAAQVEPMPDDPGVAIDQANVVAILGLDSEI